MRRFVLSAVLFFLALTPAMAQADVSGLWVGDLLGSKVECHLEQRGKYLWGVAYVTAPNGERNTYHLTGQVTGQHFFAYHSSGHRFVGDLKGSDEVRGTLTLGNGLSFAVHADRTQRGITVPGGMAWPEGYPPAN